MSDFTKILFKTGERVQIKNLRDQIDHPVELEGMNGTIIGNANHYPILYIILLDIPLTMPGYEGQTGIALPGFYITNSL